MELFHCHVSDEAKRLVGEVLDSGRLTQGPMVGRFEQALAEFGLCNPVTTNSGTSALHLALLAAEVGPGDEVILPPQTFVATGMAVLYCRATPVFADVDPTTGNIDMEDMFRRHNERTAAVIGVDWTGLPCDVPDLTAWNAQFVEDAAHSFGAVRYGNNIGKVVCSNVCCFSFQGTKHLNCGDGGALCTWYNARAKLIRHLRWFGIVRDQPVGELGERNLALDRVGFKYHMNDLAAAVGLGNLHGFPERLAKRQANGAFLRRELADVPGVTLPTLPADRTHAYYVFPLLVERRADFCRAMKSRGIPASVVCSRIDKHPIFGGRRDDLPGMDEFDAKQINTCCHEALTDTDLEHIVRSIKAGW